MIIYLKVLSYLFHNYLKHLFLHFQINVYKKHVDINKIKGKSSKSKIGVFRNVRNKGKYKLTS